MRHFLTLTAMLFLFTLGAQSATVVNLLWSNFQKASDNCDVEFSYFVLEQSYTRSLFKCVELCVEIDLCADVFYQQGRCTLANDARGCAPSDVRHFVKVGLQVIELSKN